MGTITWSEREKAGLKHFVNRNWWVNGAVDLYDEPGMPLLGRLTRNHPLNFFPRVLVNNSQYCPSIRDLQMLHKMLEDTTKSKAWHDHLCYLVDVVADEAEKLYAEEEQACNAS